MNALWAAVTLHHISIYQSVEYRTQSFVHARQAFSTELYPLFDIFVKGRISLSSLELTIQPRQALNLNSPVSTSRVVEITGLYQQAWPDLLLKPPNVIEQKRTLFYASETDHQNALDTSPAQRGLKGRPPQCFM